MTIDTPEQLHTFYFLLEIVCWCVRKLETKDTLLKFLVESLLVLLHKFSLRDQENSRKSLIQQIEYWFLNESLNLLNLCTEYEPSLISCLYQFKHKEALIHNLFIKQWVETLHENTFVHFQSLLSLKVQDPQQCPVNFFFVFMFKDSLPKLLTENGIQDNYLEFFKFGVRILKVMEVEWID